MLPTRLTAVSAILALALGVGCKDKASKAGVSEKQESNSPWQNLHPGVHYQFFESLPSNEEARLHVLSVELSEAKFTAIDAKVSPLRVGEMAKRNQGVFFINGTFFDPDKKPLGLLLDDDQVLNPLRKADWGVFRVTDAGVEIVHTNEYQELPKTEFAIQCGPRVVIDGQVPRLKPQGARRRSGLCVRSPKVALVFASEGLLTTKAMGDFLASKQGLGCKDAMLLDGGPSTQAFLRTKSDPINVVGLYPVPNGVAVEIR